MPAISLFRNEPGHRELSTGDVLFEAGDPASHVYGVVAGEIEIVVDGEVVETVGPDRIFGELALLGDHHRLAGARAATDSVIAEVDEARFLALVKMNPFFALEMMREMAERFERQQRPA